MRRVLIFSFPLVIFCLFIFFFNNKKIENFNYYLIKITKLLQLNKEIKSIEILNNKYISKNYILRSINMIDKSKTYVFDRDKLRAKLNSINEIKNFSFELMKNGNLLIKIIEKTPFMVLTNDNIKKYIDNNGKILKVSGVKENKYVELSGKNVLKFIDEIDKSFSYNSKNYHLIEKIVLKNHNSWFVIFRDGICLITSIKELDKTLNIFENIKKLEFYKSFSHFDMRINERIYVSNKSCLI